MKKFINFILAIFSPLAAVPTGWAILGTMRNKKQPIPRELREQVFARDNYICQYCGSTEKPLHADHVYPESRGGETTLENLITACRKCNGKKGRKVGLWPRKVLIKHEVEVQVKTHLPLGVTMGVVSSLMLSYAAGIVLNLFPPIVAAGFPILIIVIGMFFIARGK